MIKTKRKTDLERIIMILFLLLPLLLVPIFYDNDFWFLLNHGRYVVENGIPYVEPFTVHADFKFVMQQWLFAAFFWLIYSNFGKLGIMLCMYCFAAIILTLSFKICILLSDNNFNLSVVVAAVNNVMILSHLFTRPQSVTYIVLLCEILCFEKYIRNPKIKYLIPLPFLSVLQINVHASMWLMLFAFALPYLINSFKINIGIIKSEGYRKLPLFLTTIIMLAAGFINPYGLDAITYVFRSFGINDINKTVIEMKPANISMFLGKILFITLLVIVLLHIFYREGKTEIRFILLFSGTLLLALLNIRSIPLFFIGGVLPYSYFLKNVGDRLTIKLPGKRGKMILNLMLFSIIILYIAAPAHKFLTYDAKRDLPNVSDAVDYLLSQENPEDIVLYVGYNNGGYTEFKGIKSYLDPRAEIFFKSNNKKEDVFKEYLSLCGGDIHYKEVFDKYDFTHILAEKDYDVMYVYLAEDDDYKMIYEDEECRLFVPVK